MASPPYNLDISDPTDGAIGNTFPANERTFRDNVNSYINTEHDINTGYHKFQELTTTQKNALSSPPNGMIVYDTTLANAQINTGTAGAPVWTDLQSTVATASKTKLWLYQFSSPGSSPKNAVVGDSMTTFSAATAGGALTVNLPNTATISAGWTAEFVAAGGNTCRATVEGSHAERILVPQNQSLTTFVTAASNYENFLLGFDGTNFEVLAATPATWQANGSWAVGLKMSLLTASGAFTIPATNVKFTGIAGGGGGGAGGTVGQATEGGGGASGGYFIATLTGLTVGNTLTVAIGSAGSAGAADGGGGGNGGNTILSSGTQTITTRTAFGGLGGAGGGVADGVGGADGGQSTGAAGDFLGQGSRGFTQSGVSLAGYASTLSFMGPFGWGSVGGTTHTNGTAGVVGIMMAEWFG